MIVSQPVIVQQKKLKPKINIDTPTNQIDLSNQSIQHDPKNDPPSNKNLIENKPPPAFPYLYQTIQKQESIADQKDEQPKCWHILFPQFNLKSVNFVMIVFLSLYFTIYYVYHYFENDLIGCTLYEYGALFTPVLYHEGHFHRLLLSIPLFGGLLHALISVLTVMMFGFILEKYLGWIRFVLTIVYSAFFGNLIGALVYPYHVSVGTPGLIFSILTMNLSFLINKSHLLGPQRNLIVSLFVMMIGVNFLTMIDTKSVNIANIFGGIWGSGMLSLFFYKKQEITQCYKRIQILSLFIMVVFTILFITLIFTQEVDQISLRQWC